MWGMAITQEKAQTRAADLLDNPLVLKDKMEKEIAAYKISDKKIIILLKNNVKVFLTMTNERLSKLLNSSIPCDELLK